MDAHPKECESLQLKLRVWRLKWTIITDVAGGFWSLPLESPSGCSSSRTVARDMIDENSVSNKPALTCKRFVKYTLIELRHNAFISRQWFALDAGMLIVCAILFYSNRLFLIDTVAALWPGTTIAYIATCHLNDFIGGFAFMCYVNLLLDLVKPQARFKSPLVILIFISLCGLFWEYAAPAFVAESVSDPIDVLSYAFGGLIYWLVTRACSHIGLKMRGSDCRDER